MNISISKNHIVRIDGDVIVLDGIEIPTPPHFNGRNSNLTTSNDKIYLNGYEWKDGKWKRTLTALWHRIF